MFEQLVVQFTVATWSWVLYGYNVFRGLDLVILFIFWQDEEEEDIDKLVTIHRLTNPRHSLKSGSSVVSSSAKYCLFISLYLYI